MTTYAQYAEQIAKLQSLAEAAREAEINDAIKKINHLMQRHGVTVDDLASTRSFSVTKAKGTIGAQFKNPETEETRIGRSRVPPAG